ncbi:hypothetical protein ACYTJF_004238 [Escherichia albertii]
MTRIITRKKQKELINNNRKDDFEEGTVKNGASLCDSHECDSLGIEEAIKNSVLDDLEASSEEIIKEKDKNSDVNKAVNRKNTPCPAIDDDDEPLPDPDEDDDLCDGDDDELPDFEDDYGW